MFTVLYKDIYINLVVIVNERKTVDKYLKLFVNSCLRHEKGAGQGLYRSGTVVGQKNGCGQSSWFCTSHPVDIQRVIHTELARIFIFGLQIFLQVFKEIFFWCTFLTRFLVFLFLKGFDGLLKKGNIYV